MSDWSGERVGQFVTLEDQNGLRFAVRPASVSFIGDSDLGQTETVMLVSGKTLVLPLALEHVLDLLAIR